MVHYMAVQLEDNKREIDFTGVPEDTLGSGCILRHASSQTFTLRFTIHARLRVSMFCFALGTNRTWSVFLNSLHIAMAEEQLKAFEFFITRMTLR